MRNKTILVTGAGGLLGRHVLGVVQPDCRLHAIVHRDPPVRVPEVTYHLLDLASDWSVECLPRRVDAIIHLAQSSKFRDFPDSAMDVFRVNIESTAKLLDYAKQIGVERFVYASSGGVYGKGRVAFAENSPIASPGQFGYYLGSKMCSEILVQSYASLMHVIVLRPFFIFGSKQNRSMLIPRLMDNVAEGRVVTLKGSQGIRINPVHAKDAASAVVSALNLNQSSTFNIAGPDILSIREICEGMGNYLGKQPIFQIECGDSEDIIGNNASMCELLICPRIRLCDSYADIVS